MNFAREGYPFLVGATVLAAITFGLALRLRSWPLWLVAFGFTLAAICVSWFFREPASAATTAAVEPASAASVALSIRTPSFLHRLQGGQS